MLVDSVADSNAIDREQWEIAEDQGIRCKSSGATKKLFPYASKQPMKVAGPFHAQVKAGLTMLDNVEFVVIVRYGTVGVLVI